MTETELGTRQTMMGGAAAAAGRVVPIPPASGRVASTAEVISREGVVRYVWIALRLCMAWTFIWPFFDKMFGLGHETASAESWINGGNPTLGFLSNSVGPFSGIYQDIAGSGLVNVLFMAGLIVIGIGLLLGIYMRFACGAGVLMLMLMWSASLPPENNLFMDDHIIFALVLVGLVLVGAGKIFGFGDSWEKTSVVRDNAWLK
jgi:thiosulfate dehydrogenase [quinone] large subunit